MCIASSARRVPLWEIDSSIGKENILHIALDLQACQSPESGRRGIGRYSLSLAKAIAARPRGHRISILLNSAMGERIEFLRAQFESSVAARDVVVWRGLEPTGFARAENAFRRRASEVLRREALRSMRPDVVHVASVFEGIADNVVSTLGRQDGYLNAVTLYDLIPLVHSEVYLADPTTRNWYMDRLEQFRSADQMLGISRFSCEEAIQLLGVDTGRVTNILGAADDIFVKQEVPAFYREDLLRRYGIGKPFLMYAGGFDSRKNIGALIRAFSALPFELRAEHQLIIVGLAPLPERQALERIAEHSGLSQEDVVFAGFVPDRDLVRMYNMCKLYAFPSRQEGFGLPALEAMASGAIVIGSNTSSLPEVIGMEEALFDPMDDDELSAKIAFALTDEGFRRRFSEHAERQVAKFSWEESARRALDGMEEAFEREQASRKPTVRVSAVEDERTALLPAPASRFKEGRYAHIFGDSKNGFVGQRSLAELRRWKSKLDRVVVEVEDDPYCAKAIKAAEDFPADIVAVAPTIGRVWKALAANERSLLIELLYRHGGYPLLSRALDAELRPDVLGNLLPPCALERIGRFQMVVKDGAEGNGQEGGWRDRAHELAKELVCNANVATPANDRDWASFARAWVANRHQAIGDTRWFVDITNLAIRDAGTGIQRVVRHMLDELIKSPPPECRIEPVTLGDDGVVRYARGYCGRRYFKNEVLPADEPVEFAAGDVYLGLDLVAHLIPAHVQRFRRWRDIGVQLHFVVYDLLPLMRPDCFEPHLLPLFRAWYEAIAEIADGVLCISRAVADEFETWLHQARPGRQRPLNIGWFHLGADLDSSVDTAAIKDSRNELDALGVRPSILMVGTIEPRKGHAQALAAFEKLWEQGTEINLLIVGRPGWLVEELVDRIRNHPERGRRLFWFDEASDGLLLTAYQRAAALLMPSEGEGYGLPLIEAARHGLPLIVRDIPVFREVAEKHAYYFDGYDADALASAMLSWLQLHEAGQAPGSDGVQWLSWAESRNQLVSALTEARWLHRWSRNDVQRFAATDYRLKSEVGRLVRGRLKSTARSGMLLYGPYIAQSPGHYSVELRGMGHGAGWLDVCSAQGKQVHVVVPFELEEDERGDGVLFNADFLLNAEVSDLEVRLFVDASTEMAITGLQIGPSNGKVGV